MTEDQRSDSENVSDKALQQELEKRAACKCEDWGRNIENKISNLEKKVPVPLNSFFDALCVSVIIAGGAWLAAKLNWITGMMVWSTLGVIFIVIYVISLWYRLIFRKKNVC